MKINAYRSSLLHCVDHSHGHEYIPDGLLIIADGKVQACGPYQALQSQLSSDTTIEQFDNCLMTPGFIDTHIHYPQIDMIASFGEQLLTWLDKYTFPAESHYADEAHCRHAAKLFLQELVRNGTTTALVFATSHKISADVLFEEAAQLNMRLITGKVMSDRHVPDSLRDTPESSYADSKALIEKWHGQGRLNYALTPRFAPTSSEQQLQMVQRLLEEHPDVYLQTHLSENKDEIAWVKELFPWADNYLAVYDRYQMLGERSIFAHGVHLSDQEMQRMAETKSSISFCPTSNLFVGSGLFPYHRAKQNNVNVSLGTDVGGGTSFSLLQTINEAYKICQCQHYSLDPIEAFYLATLGGARALAVDDKIGSFAVGKEADFIVHDLHATPLMKHRLQKADSIEEQLFALLMLGDDRAIKKTYIMGQETQAS